MEYTWRT